MFKYEHNPVVNSWFVLGGGRTLAECKDMDDAKIIVSLLNKDAKGDNRFYRESEEKPEVINLQHGNVLPLTFRQELTQVINRHSKELSSNTPDFILARYLDACLTNFDVTIELRDEHNKRSGKV